jgi:hypothetical protein
MSNNVDYMIKPEAGAKGPDTSDWPLLLKVFIFYYCIFGNFLLICR